MSTLWSYSLVWFFWFFSGFYFDDINYTLRAWEFSGLRFCYDKSPGFSRRALFWGLLLILNLLLIMPAAWSRIQVLLIHSLIITVYSEWFFKRHFAVSLTASSLSLLINIFSICSSSNKLFMIVMTFFLKSALMR